MPVKVDPVLKEVWKVKDTLAAKHKYDVAAMFRELRSIQQSSSKKHVRLQPRKLKSKAR